MSIRQWISPRYIRERSIDSTPGIERSIPLAASHAWISTSEAPRSRRLNARTTIWALGRSTTSRPSSPHTYPNRDLRVRVDTPRDRPRLSRRDLLARDLGKVLEHRAEHVRGRATRRRAVRELAVISYPQSITSDGSEGG